MALPLVARREYNHDSTVYTFGLPEGQSLSLPVCACILLKAPGRGRKEGGGKDDFDGSDAVRPYTPMSDNSVLGKFELLVKRYDGGAVSSYLYGLDIGAQVEFKHIKFNVHTSPLPPQPPLQSSFASHHGPWSSCCDAASTRASETHR